MLAGKIVVAVAFTLLVQGCAPVQTAGEPLPLDPEWARVKEGMDSFLTQMEALDEYSAGTVIVIVDNEGREYIRTHGVLNAKTQLPIKEDSALYIASLTKAYVGLLAARLDEEGVLSLDSKLTDYWPDLKFPEGRDAGNVSLRDLLTHQIPIRVGELTFLEAYVREVSPDEYPALINKYAIPRDEGYAYDNLGYNIYAAIVEQQTGRDWRDWLDIAVFTPLGLDNTSGRVSDYAPESVAWGHQLAIVDEENWPAANGWFLVPPKTDGKMQSAGGLMTTAEDLAEWMRANLAKESKDGLTQTMYEAAHTDGVSYEGDGHGFSCEGYSLGWEKCRFIVEVEEGETPPDFGWLLQHAGGYTGFRSNITIAPDIGYGVAVVSNADNMTYYLALEVTKQALELMKNIPGTDERAARREVSYVERVERHVQRRKNLLMEARARDVWGGWGWRPAAETLKEYEGIYVDEDAWVQTHTISAEPTFLWLNAHELNYQLDPAKKGVFGARADVFWGHEVIEFRRDEAGDIIGFAWDDDFYVRQP